MKPFYLIILFLLAVCYGSKAQNTVTDTHPGSIIYAIDYATGQENLNETDQAILFKDALIELVSHTSIARQHLSGVVPGHKSFVVTQMNPQTNGNAYQLVLQSKFMGQVTPIYTFLYNVDENALSFYDQQSQNYISVIIDNNNIDNQNNCFAYGKFNSANPPDTDANGNQTTVAIPSDQPVDQNVSAAAVPPPIPEYQQPPCPADGYLWQPGYWAYSVDSNGYYWVPGAWVAPPDNGLLWTPPYWELVAGLYIFHGGYWGENVGFYGGINYGYGYGGYGYGGGEWYGGHYRYNTAVTRVNTTVIRNTYVNNTVINNTRVNNRVSFNGAGGVTARPTTKELAVMNQKHVMPTPEQNRNQQIARSDKSQFVANNGGRPVSVAIAKVPVRGPVVNVNGTGAKQGGNGTANSNSKMGVSNTGQGANSNTKPGATTNNATRPAAPGAINARNGLNGSTNAPNTNTAVKPATPGSLGSHPPVPGPTNGHPQVPGTPGQANTRQGQQVQLNNRNGNQNQNGSRGNRQINKLPAESKPAKEDAKKKQ